MNAVVRAPKGIPAGGQFASHNRSEADTTLATTGLPWHVAREKALVTSADLNDGMHEMRLRWLLTTPPAEAALRMREAAKTADVNMTAEQLKTGADYDPEWVETYRLMADGHLAIAQKLELASPYEHGDAPANQSGIVGAWTVSVGAGEVVAGRTDSSLVYSTGLQRFPIGWKVGQVWNPESPPKSVIAMANKLAKRL
jgi:hypothetical protein